ncbi:MAG: SPASM domain-containing protein [Acidobacteria bacterium]|nr:SPASM domain-containing protein [Acidobacteriota bacterium]
MHDRNRRVTSVIRTGHARTKVIAFWNKGHRALSRRYHKLAARMNWMAAQIQPLDVPDEVGLAPFKIRVRVKNLSRAIWNREGSQAPRFALASVLDDGGILREGQPHTVLPANVRPGDEVEVEISVAPPAAMGVYPVRFDLVQEGCYWLSDLGRKPAETAVRVAPHALVLKPNQRYFCKWPWETVVLMSDGTIVCGCADPFKKAPIGNVQSSSVSNIWNGPIFQEIRSALHSNDPHMCVHCRLMGAERSSVPLPEGVRLSYLPWRLFVEPCVACNLNCLKACCNHENGITDTRSIRLLPWELYTKVIDELGPTLHRLEFFNYGESFLHPRALDMIRYAKTRHPHIYFFGSTNGLPLNTDEKLRELVLAGMDEITFSVDGASQKVYSIYRRGGDFDKVLNIMRRLVAIRKALARERPIVNWRYLLFRWNDSDEEMNRARTLAREIGVDRLCWETTRDPEDGYSERFVPGTPAYDSIKHELWAGLGNAIEGKTLRCRFPERQPIKVAPSAVVADSVEVHNSGAVRWEHRSDTNRRQIRLGAMCHDDKGDPVQGSSTIADLERAVNPGEAVLVPFRWTAPSVPGRYRLKLDMLCECTGWFESAGNAPAIQDVVVLE